MLKAYVRRKIQPWESWLADSIRPLPIVLIALADPTVRIYGSDNWISSQEVDYGGKIRGYAEGHCNNIRSNIGMKMANFHCQLVYLSGWPFLTQQFHP